MRPEHEPGFISVRQGAWLREAARAVPSDQAIVELGSYRGKSTACLAVGSREGNSAPVVAVDLWTDHPAPFYQDPENWEAFNERIEQFGVEDLVVPVQACTGIAAQRWSQILARLRLRGFVVTDGIGLLWIDANHKYEWVRDDFNAWSPLVAPGGVVAFDDYVDHESSRAIQAKAETYQWGVRAFVDEHITWERVARVGTLVAYRKPA